MIEKVKRFEDEKKFFEAYEKERRLLFMEVENEKEPEYSFFAEGGEAIYVCKGQNAKVYFEKNLKNKMIKRCEKIVYRMGN